MDEPTSFELTSPAMSFVFEAPSEAKRNKWVTVVAENIAMQLDAHKETTKKTQDEARKREAMELVRQTAGNGVCADCDAAEPTWVSINTGAVVCHQCSGVHRKIGTHLSKVRSLTLDILEDEVVLLLRSLGNTSVNGLLEASLDRRKPSSGSRRDTRDEFISDKCASCLVCFV